MNNVITTTNKDSLFQKLKDKWEIVYSGGREKLPWVENPIPHTILENFCSLFKSNDTILDYGCGDGILAEVLVQHGLNVICSDISDKALDMVLEKLPAVATIQAEEPFQIKNEEVYDGILVWGVMHHIPREAWDNYIKGFVELMKDNGYMLIGGHSMKDPEFSKGFRVSPTTGEISNPVDSMEEILQKHNLHNMNSGYYEFTEGFTKAQRAFKYFLVQKRA